MKERVLAFLAQPDHLQAVVLKVIKSNKLKAIKYSGSFTILYGNVYLNFKDGADYHQFRVIPEDVETDFLKFKCYDEFSETTFSVTCYILTPFLG